MDEVLASVDDKSLEVRAEMEESRLRKKKGVGVCCQGTRRRVPKASL